MSESVNRDAINYDNQFIRRVMREDLLERQEELELAIAWRDHQDERALHRLVMAYSRLVVSVASKFRHYGLPVGDLIQEGNIGIMQAANRFDPDREVRFSTYSVWWIRASIQDYVLRNWSIVRTGTTSAHKSLFLKNGKGKA
jgi:RNA polymerase sigma-32 factor